MEAFSWAVFAGKRENMSSEDDFQQVWDESEAFSVEFTCEEKEKHSELKTLWLPVDLQDNHVKCKLWTLTGRIEGGPEKASYELWREDGRHARVIGAPF